MCPKRRARSGTLAGIALRQHLGLDLRHVDRRRALGLAGLAAQAQVERIVDGRVGPRLSAELAGKRGPQQVRAASGAVFLLASR